MPTSDKIGTAHETLTTAKIELPANILNRINALRNLQLETIKLESELCNKVFHLEQEFAEKLKPLVVKREQIVNGTYEPASSECKCDVEIPEDCLLTREQSSTTLGWMPGSGDTNDAIKGIPNFWLNVLKNADPITALIQEYDEPALQFLTNISMEYGDATETDDIKKFTIVFSFAPNKYFKNKELTKDYDVQVTVNNDDPFIYESPEIIGCAGCKIDWYPNMNITERVLRKKVTTDNKTKYVFKTVPRDSFFNFFSPPSTLSETSDDQNSDDVDELLEEHYEIGHFMREKLIPNAVLFYTGECADVISDYDEDEDDDDDFDEDIQLNTTRVSTDSRTDQYNEDNTDSSDEDDDDDDYDACLRSSMDAAQG